MCCSGLHVACKDWWDYVRNKEKQEPTVMNDPAPVVLHVYNLHGVSSTVNKLMRHTVGGQVLHAGVEVYGQEWSYGETEEGSGVTRCKPKSEQAGHHFCESVYMGETRLSKQAVKELLREFAREWRGQDYNLIRHNCCHFSDSFCQRLGVGPIPKYVNCLADKAATIDDMFKEADSTMEANLEKARAKTAEINNLICDTVKAKAEEIVDNLKVVTNPESEMNVREVLEVKVRDIQSSFEAASRDFQSRTDDIERKIRTDFRNTLEANFSQLRANADEFERKFRTDLSSTIEATSRDFRAHADELDRKLRQSITSFEVKSREVQAQADEFDKQMKMCYHNPNEAVSQEELVFR